MRKPLGLISVIVALLTGLRIAGAQPSDCISDQCTYIPLAARATGQLTPAPTRLARTPTPSTPVASETASPTATPVPASVHVRSERSFVEGTTRFVVGEILNSTSKPVYFTKVSAKFYDADDQLVATEATFTHLIETKPNQLNPFKLLLVNAPTTIVRYTLSLSYNTATSLDYRPITIVSQEMRDNGGTEVFGEVRNDYTRKMRAVEVVVTFYDADGEVVEVDFDFPNPATLAPNATAQYKVSTVREDLVFDRYEVRGQGYLAP